MAHHQYSPSLPGYGNPSIAYANPPTPGYGNPPHPGYGNPPPPGYPNPPPPPHHQTHVPPTTSIYPPPPPHGYSTYPGNFSYDLSASFPPGTDPEAINLFQIADKDGNGFADENELLRVFSTQQPFNLRTVRLIVYLFGSKDNRRIGPKEFVPLHKELKNWKGIFERFDRDRSGSIDKAEMRDALLSLGYSLSPPILEHLLKKYDRTGRAKAIGYDDFVECGLVVKGLTEKFKEQDKQLKGSATLDFQTFMLMVIPFIVA